jgi:Family of unknown function (DUF6519)
MKGDFSRQTFDQAKHYTAVLMQQGRVQLDADWNEQQAIYEYWAETQAQDVLGPSGAPTQNSGFEITIDQSNSTLFINAGHYYVDGILCQNERTTAYDSQPDLPDAPSALSVLQQAVTDLGIVYLDVWKRHITSLDDRSLRESALGGPDTTTRVKTLWQVKVLPVKEPKAGVVGCAAFFEEWERLMSGGTGTLSARSRPAASVDSPCIIPASAGYRGLENQLYRIEIHKGGVLGDPNNVATFKWSRDNGTVVTSIDKISGQEITVRDLGPDDVLGFASGQWVEIFDDAAELNGQPGQLLQIDQINRASRVIKLVTAPVPLSTTGNGVDPNRHPKLRRWDSVKELPVQVPATNEGFISLDNGVEVKFGAGSYSTGEHWLIPARTAISSETGTIDWPSAAPQRSHGIRHHYCRLALLRRNPGDNTLTVQDCRKLFSPLTGQGALHVIGTNWANDDVVSADQLQRDGLQITLDGFPSQPLQETPGAVQSVNSATFVVTLETPLSASADPNAILPRNATILNGEITVANNSVLWKPELAELLKLLEGPPTLRTLRVTLKGHVIWTVQQGQTLYLDGQAFARPGLRVDGQTPRTDLILPSGAGVRASDFESWLLVPAQIVSPPPDLVSFTVTPVVARAGQTVVWMATLSSAAPSGGVAIALTKTVLSGSDPVPVLPATVSVLEGQTTVSLPIATRPDAAGSVSIKATLRGVEQAASLTTQVVSVTITPPKPTMLPKSTLQFSATVAGSDNKSVTFAILEKLGGGSIAQTTITTATYTAPDQPGSYHVVATSVGDPTKSATATVTVTEKRKDSKEIKDFKEEDISKAVRDAPVLGRTAGSVGEVPDAQREEGASVVQHRRATGQAFIRLEERPPVGEPKGAAKKKSGRASRQKRKP